MGGLRDQCRRHPAPAGQCRRLKAHFIFISTDFVFDGEKGGYSETDSPNPINYYGKTKLEAEEAVGEYEYAFTIIRTVLVYGKPQQGRGNILSVVREKLEKGETYKVVGDQWRTPTYVEDLASAIVAVIDQQKTGLYHIAGKDGMTPYQMACQLANYLKLPSSLLQEVSEKDFSQPARRPLKTGFNIDKAIRELGYARFPLRRGCAARYHSSAIVYLDQCAFPNIFSPAWMATDRLFSLGGMGQLYFPVT